MRDRPNLLYWVALSMVICPSVCTAQDMVIDRSTISAWIFRQNGDPSQARMTLEKQIGVKLKYITRDYSALTEEQKQRLELAAKGDIKRFFDRVEEVYAKAEDMQIGRNDINAVHQLTVPLQAEFSEGLFVEGSLFEKVLSSTLTEEQARAKAAADRERRARAAEVTVKATISELTKTIPLTAQQRDTLAEWLLRATADDVYEGQYARYLVQYRLAALPQEQLDGLFDDQQMKAFSQMRANARGMEAFLRQQGLLKGDEASP